MVLVLLFAALSALVVAGYADGFDRRIAASLALTADTSPSSLILLMQGISWIGGGTPRRVIVILLCGLVWHCCGPRPDLTPHLDLQTSFSYPSGHATSAAAVYLMLACLAPQHWRRAAWCLAGAMIVLNGFSRMMLGVHWFSDILGGTLLGAAFALLAAWWFGEGANRSPQH